MNEKRIYNKLKYKLNSTKKKRGKYKNKKLKIKKKKLQKKPNLNQIQKSQANRN